MKDPSTILSLSTEQLPPNYMVANGNTVYKIALLLDSYHRSVLGVDPIPVACWILQRLSKFHTQTELVNEFFRLNPNVQADSIKHSQTYSLFDEAIIWLQNAGLVKSSCPGYAVGNQSLSLCGRDVYFLLLRYRKACEALDFLIDTKKRDLRFGSAEEERLNIMLVGHSEWLKHDWFVRNVSWIEEASKLTLGWTNLKVTAAWINAVQVWKKWSYSV